MAEAMLVVVVGQKARETRLGRSVDRILGHVLACRRDLAPRKRSRVALELHEYANANFATLIGTDLLRKVPASLILLLTRTPPIPMSGGAMRGHRISTF
jgi:hypothetical protein